MPGIAAVMLECTSAWRQADRAKCVRVEQLPVFPNAPSVVSMA